MLGGPLRSRTAIDVTPVVLLAALSLGVVSLSVPQERPLVLHIAGLAVGSRSQDADVVTKFGPGCFVPDEPHAGGRYFTNPKQSLTLHAVVGVDMVTEALELRTGLHLPDSCRAPGADTNLVTSKLSEPPEIDHGVHLGMSRATLVRLLGEPDTVHVSGGSEVLSYEAYYEDDPRVSLFYDGRYEFLEGILVALSISDGD